MASSAAMASGVTIRCAWPGRGESVIELTHEHELPSPLVHLLWSQTCITILNLHSSMNFDGFHPFTTSKTDARMLFFFGACCKRGRHLYTTTAPSRFIPASYWHLSATLQTMSIIVVNLQDNRGVSNFYRTFKVFIWLSLVLEIEKGNIR